jgi:hypothetical protein
MQDVSGGRVGLFAIMAERKANGTNVVVVDGVIRRRSGCLG